jgi:hypothetical protein
VVRAAQHQVKHTGAGLRALLEGPVQRARSHLDHTERETHRAHLSAVSLEGLRMEIVRGEGRGYQVPGSLPSPIQTHRVTSSEPQSLKQQQHPWNHERGVTRRRIGRRIRPVGRWTAKGLSEARAI